MGKGTGQPNRFEWQANRNKRDGTRFGVLCCYYFGVCRILVAQRGKHMYRSAGSKYGSVVVRHPTNIETKRVDEQKKKTEREKKRKISTSFQLLWFLNIVNQNSQRNNVKDVLYNHKQPNSTNQVTILRTLFFYQTFANKSKIMWRAKLRK